MKKRTLMAVLTAFVFVLTVISAFFYRTVEHHFYTGYGTQAASEPMTEGTEFRMEVQNRERISIKEWKVRLWVDDTTGLEGLLSVSLLDSAENTVGSKEVPFLSLDENQEVSVAFDSTQELRGNYTIVLRADGVTAQKEPKLAIAYAKGAGDPSAMDGTLYVDGAKTEGILCTNLVAELSDRSYFPAMLLLLLVLLAVNLCAWVSRRFDLKNRMTESGKTTACSFFLIGGFLLFELWSKNAGEICSWMGPWYVLDYGVGFGSRLFIGSLMKLLFYDGFLEKFVAYHFVMASLSILVLQIAWLAAKCIGAAKKEYRAGVGFLVLLYLASPGSVGYLWNEANMGRLETYLLMLALLAVAVNLAVKNRFIRYFLLAVISIVMFAVHQGNLFTYFPVIYLLCVCNVFREDHISGKDLAGSLVVGVSSAATFLYFHFFSYIRFDTLEEMAAYVGARTNLKENVSGLQMEYFSGVHGMFANCFALDNYSIGGVLQLIVIWPLVALAVFIAVKICRYYKKEGVRLFFQPYLYLLLFCVIYIPVFMFECDWGRWFAAIITTTAIGILYLFYTGNKGMVYAVRELGAWVSKRSFAAAVVLLYLAACEKFGSALFLTAVDRLYRWLFPFLAQ